MRRYLKILIITTINIYTTIPLYTDILRHIYT